MRDGIIGAARELFSRFGCEPVTTNHVIDRLNISPGTLYYYFRNKEEILRAVFDEISAAFDAVLPAADGVPSVNAFAVYIRNIYRICQDYRFFFIDIAMLLHKDPVLAARYKKEADKKRTAQAGLLAVLSGAGVLKKLPAGTQRDAFLDNLWMITDFWCSYHRIHYPKSAADGMRRGIDRFYYFIKPYLQARYQSPLKKALGVR